jgi:uncharacterized membrane protein YphA (DoxX/SURF4 family)
MLRRHFDPDTSELIFRILFSSIFIVLGCEHLFSDALIIRLMPEWLMGKRALSLVSGLGLLTGGGMIAIGYRVHWAAMGLGAFLVAVTTLIHVPGMLSAPLGLEGDWVWLWDVYQRSNFIKNLCLLGVCFHFLYHEPGRYSLEARLERRAR